MLVELLPRNYKDNQAFELICVQRDKLLAKFYNVTPDKVHQCLIPEFPYSLQLQDDIILLCASCDATSSSYIWLKNTLVPQFLKWSEQSESSVARQSFCTESLVLVSKEDYYKKYNELKLKYGKDMVKIWPECTDPSKFVYEDVAIATYLLLIWESQENHTMKQTFVDLGCGNGLLVYILTKEGYNGVGIDIRKRNIWDMYSSDIKLEEKTVTPSDDCLFPDIDWIIGNHSDELTPWIPVIAAKSSYKCNFFLLPCCSYNFDGSKYQRKNSFRSQYMDYLDYIKHVCNDIGFSIGIDRLKIPSTKRICFVSKGRIYAEEQYSHFLDRITEIIECDSKPLKESVKNEWISDFKARESVEKVKNCTRIDKKIIENIVDIICAYLLQGSSAKNGNWNAGKIVAINEVVQLIPPDKLKFLKSECGGLQTLMKNHHHIFLVQSGKIQLSYPKTLEEVTNNSKAGSKNKTKVYKVRQKECWFYKNHPQGCPLTDTTCSFLHGKR
ncbi:hypothetical protein K1T71_004095 [Dendrolimus kikuchii]|uniref:Uncharacterized protein n=1 Tax=Dendrolimus kikuchii TaxID=765133 RepID=A0ACC1DAL9_9NEOP|nr:hypothetical protein K1T71_004095 [Dendrolimus kikuchii]